MTAAHTQNDYEPSPATTGYMPYDPESIQRTYVTDVPEKIGYTAIATYDRLPTAPTRRPGVYDHAGNVLLEGLSSGDITSLQSLDERIVYIAPERLPEREVVGLHEAMPLSKKPDASREALRRFVLPPLEQDLRAYLEQEGLEFAAIRGAVVSVRKPVNAVVDHLGPFELREKVDTAHAMLAAGFDRPDAESRVKLFEAAARPKGAHGHMPGSTIAWLLKHTRDLRKSLEAEHPEEASWVFPAILAYRQDKLFIAPQHGPYLAPDLYSPTDDGKPSWSAALGRAYILPYAHA